MHTRRLIVFAAAGFLLGSAATASAQNSLYQQVPVSGFAASISITTGGNTFAFADRRLADSFTTDVGLDITSVRWWGGPESGNASPPLSNIAGIEIDFFEADFPPLASFEVSLAGASPELVPGQTVGILGASMHVFEVDLAAMGGLQTFGLAEYHISIAAVVARPVGLFDEAFLWGQGATGDGGSIQDRFDGNGFIHTISQDAAFELIGFPIPSPASALVLLLAAMPRRRG